MLGLLAGVVATWFALSTGSGARPPFSARVAAWWSGWSAGQAAGGGAPPAGGGTGAGHPRAGAAAAVRPARRGRAAGAGKQDSAGAAGVAAGPGDSGGGEEPGDAVVDAGARGGADAATAEGGPPTKGSGLAAGGGPAALGAAASPGARPAGSPRVALVIDDLGRSLDEVDSLERLGVPLTYAVLPFESQTPGVVAALRRHHEEILCHLPMEPRNGSNPGPGALRLGMSSEQLRQSTAAALAAVPGAVGVNNHMGSGLSADEPAMAAVMGVLAARGLFFLDSRTSAQTVGYRVATSLGVPAAERQVFLDDDLRAAAVAEQFQHLLDLALARGEAIAIGHPHPATLATLASEVPRARALGYRFVLVSTLLDRAPTAATPAAAR